MEKLMKYKHTGLTFVETMIALLLLGIVSSLLMILFTRATRTYTYSKGEQESIGRTRNQVPLILNEIKGATAVKSTLPPSGAPNVAFDYIINGATKRIWLSWNSTTEEVTRTQYALDVNGLPVNPPEAQNILVSNVDYLSFYSDSDSPQLINMEYRIAENLPNPLIYTYKLLYAPKLPVPAEEE